MFQTLRSKLIFSYVMVAGLCLLLAMMVLLALALNFSEQTTFSTLREKAALAFPFIRIEYADRQRPALRPALTTIRDGILNSHLRVMLVNPSTGVIDEDIASGSNAAGKPFPIGASQEASLLTTPTQAVEGRFRLPGEKVTYLYVARVLRAATGTGTGPVTTLAVVAQAQRGVVDLLQEFVDYMLPATAAALAVALVVGYLLARSISRPIDNLAAGAAAIARGDFGNRLPVEGRDELAGLTRRFNEMAEEVGRAHQMERDFVANVSHDLKTPLTSIQGFSQAILDGAVTEEPGYKQAASIINAEALRMSRLVTELVGLSRLQDGLTKLVSAPTDTVAVVRQLVDAMQPQASVVQVQLEFAPGPESAWVRGDADRLKQAIGNLIDNAIKFSPPGGTVNVGVKSSNDTVTISVMDGGQGIPPEDLPRVTERFYQVDKARSSSDGRSAGLGLAIAREIVRAHMGELRIDSRAGEGTVVSMNLPALPVPSEATTTRRSLWWPGTTARSGQVKAGSTPPSLPGAPGPTP